MKREWRVGWGVWALAAAAVLANPASGQAAARESSSPRIVAAPAREASAALVIREIDDPATGMRWLLERDPSRPGGPGRLVPVSGRGWAVGPARQRGTVPRPIGPAIQPALYRPVIRAGDRLVIEENTPVVEARLAAVALGPAAAGASFAARLQFGGTVVQAVAVAPGRATLAPEARGWK